MTIPHVPYGAQRVDPTPSAPPARLAEVGLGMAVPSFSAAPAAAILAAQAAPVAPPSTPAAPAHPEPATPVEPHPAPQVEVHPEPAHHPEPTSSAAPAHPEPAATSTPAPAAAGGGNPPPPVTPMPAAVAAPEPQPAPVLATVQGEPLSPIASVAARQRAAAVAVAETPQATPPAQRAAVPSDRWMLLKVGMIVLAVIAGFGLGFYVFWPKGQQAVIPVNPTPVVVHPPAPAQPPPVIIHNYPPPAATPAPAPAQPQTPFSGNAGGQVTGDSGPARVATSDETPLSEDLWKAAQEVFRNN